MAAPIDLFPLLLFLVLIMGGAGAVLAGWAVRGRQRTAASAQGEEDAVTQAVRELHTLADQGTPPVPPGGPGFMDHAEAALLRVAQARTSGKLDDVAGFLTPAYFETLRAEWEADPAAAVLTFTVEASRVLSVVPGHPQDTVEAWFGVTAVDTSAPGAGPVPQTMVAGETVRFVRAAGLPDTPDALTAARVCHNCGAALGDASGKCPFCGQVLVGNTHGWLIDRIEVRRIL